MKLAKKGRSGQHYSSVRVRACSRHNCRALKSPALLTDKDRWRSLIQANKRGGELTGEKTEALPGQSAGVAQGW